MINQDMHTIKKQLLVYRGVGSKKSGKQVKYGKTGIKKVNIII